MGRHFGITRIKLADANLGRCSLCRPCNRRIYLPARPSRLRQRLTSPSAPSAPIPGRSTRGTRRKEKPRNPPTRKHSKRPPFCCQTPVIPHPTRSKPCKQSISPTEIKSSNLIARSILKPLYLNGYRGFLLGGGDQMFSKRGDLGGFGGVFCCHLLSGI